jgi:hypothetical protein
VCLAQDAAQRADCNLGVSRNDDRIDELAGPLNKLYVTALLAGSAKPAASRRRFTSRKGSGLSRPNLDLNGADFHGPSSYGRFEVKLQRLPQVSQRFLFVAALAGHIYFKTLRYKPVAFAPYFCRKWTLHSVYCCTERRSYCSSVPVSPSPFFSSGGITTAAATLSPSSMFSSFTPCVERPASRMVVVSMRMILPY